MWTHRQDVGNQTMRLRTLKSLISGQDQRAAQYAFLAWIFGMGIIWSIIGIADSLAQYWNAPLPPGLID